MMEGGGVVVTWLIGVATVLGGVSGSDVGVALQGEAEELRGMAEVVVYAVDPVEAAAGIMTGTDSVKLCVAVEDMRIAEGTKGLASTLRADPAASVAG